MSRISDALARAAHPQTVAPTAEVSVPWDFTDLPLAAPAPAVESEAFIEAVVANVGPRVEEPVVRPPSTSVLVEPAPAIAPAPFSLDASAYVEKLILSQGVNPGFVEQFRRLGGVFHRAQAEHGIKVVMITSALPGEGKTLTACNLALTMSLSYGRRVLLMDVDLRRPMLHNIFGVENRGGIADRLQRGQSIPPVQVSSTLSLLVAGRSKNESESVQIITGEPMRQLIADAATQYDWVVIDTPPVGLVTEAHLMAAMADRVLFVVQAGKTPYDAIKKSVETIGKERIMGTVLNRADATLANSSYAYYRHDADDTAH
jgi:protein-tyrosine kinase